MKEYITFGPGQLKDERWDMKIIAINYKGQEIEIGGVNETKVCDINTGKWTPCYTNLSNARSFKINGLEIKICDPYELAEYKKMLLGDHQKRDIQAIKKFLKAEVK